MNKQIIVRDFSELKYVLKAGKTPPPVREKHIGNWQLMYGNTIISADVPYPVAVEHQKLYKRMGNIYPDKTKFKIRPYKG